MSCGGRVSQRSPRGPVKLKYRQSLSPPLAVPVNLLALTAFFCPFRPRCVHILCWLLPFCLYGLQLFTHRSKAAKWICYRDEHLRAGRALPEWRNEIQLALRHILGLEFKASRRVSKETVRATEHKQNSYLSLVVATRCYISHVSLKHHMMRRHLDIMIWQCCLELTSS